MEPCVNMKNYNKPIQSYKLIVANTERRETRGGGERIYQEGGE